MTSRFAFIGIPIHGLCLAGSLAMIAGCASVDTTKSDATKTASDTSAQKAAREKPPAKPKPPTITAQREQRYKTVIAEFDRQRDRAQYQAALSRWQQGDSAGSRETLAPFLARNPDDRDGQLLAAQLDLFDDKPQAALEHARRILVAHVDDPQAHYEAAVALDAMGQAADALPHYEKAAQLAPQEEVYQASYQSALGAGVPPPSGSAGLNSSPNEAGRAAGAENLVYSQDDQQSPDSDRAVNERLAVFRREADEHPDDPQIALDAAVYALGQNRPPAAIDFVTAALRRFPDSAPLYRLLGMAQYRHGDYAAAQLSLGRAISLDKSNALAYFSMGSTLARLGDAEAARRHFDEAARLDPRFGDRPN